ncbi:MAG: AraC family transcriptional regulator [Planctomycetota bacterium]|nr:AraC family transcriptional regulator [Planctomycetota bacterium]
MSDAVVPWFQMKPAIITLDMSRLGMGEGPGVHVFRSPTPEAVTAHDHVFHEIVFVETGTAEHVTAGEARKLRPGDVIVIQPQVWHAYHAPRGFCIINCLIARGLIQRFGGLLEEVDGAFELFRRRARRPELEPPVVLHARPADRPAFLHHFETIMQERAELRNGWQVAVTAELLKVLLLTARLRGEAMGQQGSGMEVATGEAVGGARLADRTAQAVLDTVSHLESHFAGRLRLAALSQRVHLSPGHLSRAFGKRMGMGVMEYVGRLRIEEACRLLRWSDQPVKAVAAKVGYDEIAYFSRRFKEATGESPRAYRRKRLQDAGAVRP